MMYLIMQLENGLNSTPVEIQTLTKSKSSEGTENRTQINSLEGCRTIHCAIPSV